MKLNCAAIPSELLESELFGHKRGSFTGAQQDRIGKFIAADGGTLFLDEIGDMSIELQAKLLRVLDEGEVEVVGENFPRKVDVRIISATNKNLKLLIEQEKFRKDLFHRLNVVNIHLQPLRERREDIIPLLNHFLKKFGEDYNKPQSVISPQAGALLENQRWEGNVRELKNVAEKLVLFSSGSEISINDVYQVLRLPSESPERLLNLESMELKQAKTEFEKRYIISVLESNDWKMNETAAVLGIDRTNLFKKMQILGIEKRVSQ